MTREQRKEWAESYFRRFGFLPLAGGEPDDDEGDDADEDDEDDDEEDDDEGGEPAKRKQSSRSVSTAEVNRIVRERLTRERASIEKKLRTKIEAENKIAQAKLDKDLQKELDAIRPKAELATELEELVLEFSELADAEFEAALEDLPDFIREMAPDEDADPIEKKRWLVEKALPAAKKFKAKEDKNDDKDESDPKKKALQTRRRTAKLGLNPDDPKDRKAREERVKEILGRFKSSKQYKGM